MRHVLNESGRKAAYFSMEVGLKTALPTYSGGLGVLAGDTLRAAADVGLPMVGVTMLYHKGYFTQKLDSKGKQSESPTRWNPEDVLERLPQRVVVRLEGREVLVGAWVYHIQGASGHVVPVIYLDTRLPENDPYDQTLCDSLYGGDKRYRLCQETVLGIGGIRMLETLGFMGTGEGCGCHSGSIVYHMNEGHSALLTVALLERQLRGIPLEEANEDDLEALSQQCVFTTHTPVPYGHDTFDLALVQKVLGKKTLAILKKMGGIDGKVLNMTHLALHCSRFANGVAKRHGEVSRDMFPGEPIAAITNGVHAATWVSDPFQALFDRLIPEWRTDNSYLRYVADFDPKVIDQTHAQSKRAMIAAIKKETGASFSEKVFTIGFARRATEYKRASLLFSDIERLKKIAAKFGGLQIVYAGKAHPMDFGGKAMIEKVFEAGNKLKKSGVKVVFLENYNMTMGRLLTSGVDIWLNTPLKPLEASGTSGMKAAMNGVPSLSTLDGWWVEGCFDGVTGWEIADSEDAFAKSAPKKGAKGKKGEVAGAKAAEGLYECLENVILPLYDKHDAGFAKVRRGSIALNGSFFNTERMVLQYAHHAYGWV
jgi:starch phosphorylase